MITDEQVKIALTAYHDEHHHHPELMIDMRKALEVYEQSKWISVKDRLPDIELPLILEKPRPKFLVAQSNNMVFMSSFDGVGFDLFNVTHWQPLPEFRGTK